MSPSRVRRVWSRLGWCGLVVAMASLAHPPPAFAQDVATAEALFREGRALMAKGELGPACEKLASSQRLDPSPGTAINLALCHEKQGKRATAWAEYLVAARLARAADKKVQVDEASKRAAELEPDLDYVTIVISTPVPGLEVVRDGVVLDASSFGSALPIDPGPHAFVARAPGYQSVTLNVTFAEKRDKQSVSVPTLEREEAATTPGPAPSSSGEPVAPSGPSPAAPGPGGDHGARAEPDRSLAWVLVGVGGAALLTAGVFGVLALGNYSDADGQCPGHRNCLQSTADLYDRASLQANIANIGVGVGLVGLGIGTVLLFTSGSSTQVEHATAPRGRSVVLFPYASPTSAGLGLWGHL